MKKLLAIALCSLTIQLVFAEKVQIYNGNFRRLLVNYQICGSDDPHKNHIECDPPVKNIIFKRNQSMIEIFIPDDVFFVKVISAYQYDEEDIISAEEEFSHCSANSIKPIVISQSISNPRSLVCESKKFSL